MTNPRQLVPGPTFAPLPFGITSVAQVLDDPDPHWRNGIKWEALCADAAPATLDTCAEVLDLSEGHEEGAVVAADPPAKTPNSPGPDYPEGDAFTLYAVHRCSSVGRSAQADHDRAGALLANGEDRGLTQVLITGETEAGILAHSLSAQATDVPGDGNLTDIGGAIGAIEHTLGIEYGGVGVIWLPRWVALRAVQEFAVVRDGGRLTTSLGTPVAVTNHVPQFDLVPGGIPIYGTGAVTLYRGPVTTLDGGLDREVNRSTVIAERTWAAGWDCVTVRAIVALSDVYPVIPPPEA